jgi:hypothetical protein
MTTGDWETADGLMFGDLEHYCAQVVTIKKKGGQLANLVWNAEQRYLHERLEEQRRRTGKVRAIIIKARQRGISTYICARFYHRATTRMGQRVFILTHEDSATENLFGMVARIHENVPEEYRPRATQDSASALEFGALVSGYRVGTARTKARGRSDTIQLLHGSEVAFWPNAEDHAAGILQAVPDLPSTEIILESTGNGIGGWFYEQVMLAEKGISEYQIVFIPWYWATEYRREAPNDWEPSPEEQEYAETYRLDPAQLYWAHIKNIELGGDTGSIGFKFRQEYPANLQEAFQTSGDKAFISGELVMRARTRTLPVSEFAPTVLGIDVARGGKAKTTIIDRKGRRAGHQVKIELDSADLMATADVIARLLRDEDLRVRRAFIDVTGVGGGVYDRLVQLHYGERVVQVHFGGEPTDKRAYLNKRAEMWDRMRLWLREAAGVDLIDDDMLHQHLCAPVWRHSSGCRYDAADRLILERKEEIEGRVGFSPDWGDSLALTFTEEIFEPLQKPEESAWMRQLLHHARAGSRPWMRRGGA